MQVAEKIGKNVKARILIVDDEEGIRKSLEGILADEGFETLVASDGESALNLIRTEKPSLVILDIWMPGMDGIETLGHMKSLFPDLPVIMVSGHATIATAIRATRLGAVDFLEKPLDLQSIINAVTRALHSKGAPHGALPKSMNEKEQIELGIGVDSSGVPTITPIVFRDQFLRGAKVPQKTLAHSALLYGQGLHSGKKSGLILEPLPANSGIHFVGVSGHRPVPAHVEYVESTGFATMLKLGQTEAGTIEHVMSALHAYGVTNLLVKCNGEVPVMDGSAREFCQLIEQVGLEEQAGDWYALKVKNTVEVGDENEFIRIEPADEFVINYTLKYPDPVGTQKFEFTLSDIAAYKREIAPARTFGFVKDVGALQRAGLALGGRFDNFVLMGPEGAINDALRFPDEQVRHKILDAIGDLYLLGRPIHGKITAQMTGHSDNVLLLRKIIEQSKA